ncbi:MAG: hypothetical protein Q7V05_13390 [Methanoregula sp.]|nr:hypothetical protein [Methanoregula sp.]
MNYEKFNFGDFTEDEYRKLIKIAIKKFDFISYQDYKKAGHNILWRHDVDVSIHRAFSLAKIEAEEGIKSTFFLHLHSIHYNLFEDEITSLINKILELDHEIGLHFDPVFFESLSHNKKNLHEWIEIEKNLLDDLFDKRILVISIHQPDTTNALDLKADYLGGLVNTYSKYIMKHYTYCSDSNGYWRFQRLFDLLNDSDDNNLQILTHPEWWTYDVLSPRDRISRCINGRNKKQHMRYDLIMNQIRRKNVR